MASCRHRKKKKTNRQKRCFLDDWQSSGAKQFGAIKDSAYPVVNSVNQISGVAVKLWKPRRKSFPKFRPQDDDLQLCTPGTILSQGKSQATVSAVDTGIVSAMIICGSFRFFHSPYYNPFQIHRVWARMVRARVF